MKLSTVWKFVTLRYLCNFLPPISWCLYLTWLSTNMLRNTVSSESHISSITISIHLYFFVSLAPHLFVFPHFFFPLFLFTLCFFTVFFPMFPIQPHTLSPQSALPHPLPSLFIQSLASFVLCSFPKIGLGRETFSCETKVSVEFCVLSISTRVHSRISARMLYHFSFFTSFQRKSRSLYTTSCRKISFKWTWTLD